MKAEDFDSLQEYREYPQWIESLIHRDTFNGYLASVNVYSAMKKIARTEGHPVQNDMDAFMDSVEFNFMQNSPTGILQIAAYESLVAANISIEMNGVSVPVSQILGQLKPVVLSRANTLYFPNEKATKQDFDIAHGTINRVAITKAENPEDMQNPVVLCNGYCILTTSADCEKHNPQVYRKVTFADNSFEYVRVAGFRDVEIAKTYRIQCPSFPDMYVDNAYGVVS
jgi:hypothetical protein